MIHLKISPEFRKHVKVGEVRAAVKEILLQEGVSKVDLSLVLTGDEQVRALNRDFRGMDSTTDVLSFPASNKDPQTERTYLGDVIISVPQAEKSTSSYNHPLDHELALLAVHGVLHLLGYDHATAQEEKGMWSKQAKVLSRLGFSTDLSDE